MRCSKAHYHCDKHSRKQTIKQTRIPFLSSLADNVAALVVTAARFQQMVFISCRGQSVRAACDWNEHSILVKESFVQRDFSKNASAMEQQPRTSFWQASISKVSLSPSFVFFPLKACMKVARKNACSKLHIECLARNPELSWIHVTRHKTTRKKKLRQASQAFWKWPSLNRRTNFGDVLVPSRRICYTVANSGAE